jgi:hypothetical protein
MSVPISAIRFQGGGEDQHVRFDGPIAGRELDLARVEEFQLDEVHRFRGAQLAGIVDAK